MKTATTCHAVFCFCLLLVVGYSAHVDAWLSTQWSALRESLLFQHDSFEPLLVTFSVMVFSSFFKLLDYLPALTQRWRLQDSTDVSHWKLEGKR